VKILRDESGQTLIFVALSLTFILGMVGLATDVGTLLHAKMNLQIAADSAAIAGASELKLSTVTADVQGAAAAAATSNGITNGVNGAVVTVHNPPTTGPHTGAASYVEVIISQAEPTFFMKLFSFSSMTVAARAVAFYGAASHDCFLTTATSGADTLHVEGSFNVDAPGCQVMDDSKDPNALYFTGAGGTLTAGTVGVAGGAGGATGDSTPAPVTGVAPVSDPLASLPPPPTVPCAPPPSTGSWDAAGAGGTVCYSGNIKINSNVTMTAGTYVFTGDLDFTGNGTLNGTGVTLYFAAPNGQLGGPGNGNTTINLTAPTSGTYSGILIYQDPNDTNTGEFNGTPIETFSGIVYMPGAEFELSGNTTFGGNPATTLVTDIIVNSFYAKGNATVNIKDYSSTAGNSPLKAVALVE
jgi:Flp pilus assembly protein TadG